MGEIFSISGYPALEYYGKRVRQNKHAMTFVNWKNRWKCSVD